MSLRVCFSSRVCGVCCVCGTHLRGCRWEFAKLWEGSCSALARRGGAREFSGEGEGCFVGGFFLLVRGSLRVSAVFVGSFAGVGGGVPVRAVVAATSSSVLSIFFYVRARKAAQAPSSRTLLLCRIQTLARTPSEMAGAYFSTFSCMFTVMR